MSLLSALSTRLGLVKLTGHLGGTAASPTVVNHDQITGTDDLHTEYLKANGSRSLGGDLDADGYKLTGLGAGSNPNDSATYGQLLSFYRGMDYKDSVRVATAAALPANTRSGGTLTANANGALNDTGIDGVTDLALNERVLVKNESSSLKNGIYIVSNLGSAGSPWVLDRAGDADEDAEVTSGLMVSVEEGSTIAGHTFKLTTPNPITLNTTGLAFTDMAAAVSFGSPVALNGTSTADGSASTAAKSDHQHGAVPGTDGDDWGSSSKRWDIRAREVYVATAAKTADYTCTGGEYFLTVDATSGNVAIDLPQAVGQAGRTLVIKRIDASGNTVTINRHGLETIDGATSVSLVNQWEVIALISDGSNFQIV